MRPDIGTLGANHVTINLSSALMTLPSKYSSSHFGGYFVDYLTCSQGYTKEKPRSHATGVFESKRASAGLNKIIQKVFSKVISNN